MIHDDTSNGTFSCHDENRYNAAKQLTYKFLYIVDCVYVINFYDVSFVELFLLLLWKISAMVSHLFFLFLNSTKPVIASIFHYFYNWSSTIRILEIEIER